MKESKSALKVSFPVAATWFGALFGPSLMSGAYAAAYFLPYGSWAIVLPFIAFTVICAFAGLAANIVRTHRCYDYSSFAKVIYGKAYRILMPLLDYDILMAMCLGGASCIATVSTLLSRFGIPPLVSAVAFSALSLLIAVYGETAVRKFSSVMTFAMMIAFVLFAVTFIYANHENLGNAMSNWRLTGDISLPQGIKGALLLGLSNFGMVGGSLCAVEQDVTTKKECRQIAYLSYIMNSMLMAIGSLMLMVYYPEILGDATPTVTVMERYIEPQFPFISVAYFALMFMALITSAVPQVHAVTSRIGRMANRNFDENPAQKRKVRFYIGAVYFAVCIALSLLGLMTIVSKGYSFSAYMHICLLAIPIVVWYIRKLPVFNNRR